jgi:hypothetical protein
MLIVSLLAGASSVLLVSVTPAQQSCAAQQNSVPVSHSPKVPDVPNDAGKLPDAAPKGRAPAVLLPECKAEPRVKRKKRLSDYPMG